MVLKKRNKTLISLLLSGDGRREIRPLFPFAFREWKKGNKTLISLCFPGMEEGK